MDFEKVLSLRQAVRAYTDEPVSEEQLKAILNAAYRAPVGMHNFAGYHLTVITRPELLALMVDTARKVTGKDNNPLYGAPVFILVSATKAAIQKIVGQDAGCIMLCISSVWLMLLREKRNGRRWRNYRKGLCQSADWLLVMRQNFWKNVRFSRCLRLTL